MSGLPMEDIRVADFTDVVAGPFGTRWLAAMGAEVIKVESRRRLARRGAPPFAGPPGVNTSVGFNSVNTSKLSLTLDLTTPGGRELVKRLIAISDVVADNFSTGTMERLGLGYQELRGIKPDIVVVSSGCFGRSGPYKDYVGLHSSAILASGIAAVTGYQGGHPRMIGCILPDPLTGMYEALALLHALYYRARTGEGQFIDLSMVETSMSLLAEPIMDYFVNGREPARTGNRDRVKAPHNCYRCRGEDRWVAVSVSTDEEWEALCRAVGHPEWMEDTRFSDALSRWRHQDELDSLMEEWTRGLTPEAAMAALQQAGVPAGISANAMDIVNDRHLKERGFLVSTDHPEVGRRGEVGIPWKIGGVEPPRYRPAPLLGQHNDYVLREVMGLSATEVERLSEHGVVY